LEIEDGIKIKCPTLFVRALGDTIVTDELVSKMGPNVLNFTAKEVNASHWLLWERPEEVNDLITEWMQGQRLIAVEK
jgi:soluble epoxide hydrolase/lipid-phosphate phosphatase